MSVNYKAKDSFQKRGYNNCPVCIENETEQFLLTESEAENHEAIRKFIDIEYLLTKAAALPQLLQKCSACKLVHYCSVGHQKFHWSNTKVEIHRGPLPNYHKDFCKAATQIINKRDIYLHEFMGEIKTRQDITRAILELLKILPKAMSRKLSPWERNCVIYPKYCNNCLKFKTINKFTCNNCRCICYCSEECKAIDFELHQKYCEELRISYNLFTVIEDYNLKLEFYGPKINFHQEFDAITALEKCTLTTIPRLPQDLDEYQIFSTASDYGYVMTMHNILERCNIVNPNTLIDHFVIYLVGRNTWLTLTQTQFLIAQLPNIKNITFVLVGHVKIDGMDIVKKMEINKYSRNGNANVIMSRYTLKETFLKELKQLPPNLIICFNANFVNETSYGEDFQWNELIYEFLRIKNIPIIFTGFSFKESESNLNYFYRAAHDMRIGCSLLVQNEYNKFKELNPIRNWNFLMDDNCMIYPNSYINIVVCY